MTSVEYLFMNNCLQQKVTVVWGNLGRRGSLLNYYVSYCFEGTVRIRPIDEDADDEPCDVLIWLEPNFLETITKPSYVKRLIVLTSHLHLILSPEIPIVIHHVGDIERTHPNNFKGYIDQVPPNDDENNPLYILKPKIFQTEQYPPIVKEETVVVDLMECKSAQEVYLCLLNAREYLGPKGTLVRSWTVAVPLLLEMSMELNLNHKRYTIQHPILNNVDGLYKMEKHYFFHRQ